MSQKAKVLRIVCRHCYRYVARRLDTGRWYHLHTQHELGLFTCDQPLTAFDLVRVDEVRHGLMLERLMSRQFIAESLTAEWRGSTSLVQP